MLVFAVSSIQPKISSLRQRQMSAPTGSKTRRRGKMRLQCFDSEARGEACQSCERQQTGALRGPLSPGEDYKDNYITTTLNDVIVVVYSGSAHAFFASEE